MRLLQYLTLAALLLGPAIHNSAKGQNVSINLEGLPGHNSSILDVASNNRGVLLPRMTEAQRNAIPSPAEGLLLYQSNGSPGFYVFSGGAWRAVSSATAEIDMPEMYTVFSTDFVATGANWTLVPGMNVSVTIPSGKTAKAHIMADVGLVTNSNNNNHHSCTDLAILLNGGLLPEAGYKRVTAGSGSTTTHNNHHQNPVVTGYIDLSAGTYNFGLYAVRTCNGGNTRNAVLGGNGESLLQGTLSVQLIYD